MTFPTIERPGGGGLGMRCFGVGRLVLIIPKSDGQGLKYQSTTETERQITCDIVALDGGPVAFGGKADNTGRIVEPDTQVVNAIPWVAENVVLSNVSLVRAIEGALPNPAIGRPGAAKLGRLYQDAAYRNAWKLSDPTPDDFAKAEAWKAQVLAGSFVNPKPVPIAQAAQPVPAQPVYAQAAPAQPTYAQPAQAQDGPPPPPGFDPAMWAAMPIEQRRGIAVAMAGQAAVPAPQGGTGIW